MFRNIFNLRMNRIMRYAGVKMLHGFMLEVVGVDSFTILQKKVIEYVKTLRVCNYEKCEVNQYSTRVFACFTCMKSVFNCI